MSEYIGLNPRERAVYQEQGFVVLRNGAPDFIRYRIESENPVDIRAVEVKSPSDQLSVEQEQYKWLLQHVGIGPFVQFE